LGVIDIKPRIIQIVAGMETRCRAGDGAVERRRVHRNPISRAELLITRGLEPGTGINQGEINVEENRARLTAHAHGRATSARGRPSIAIAACSGCRTSAAAATTSSIVTASRMAGRR